MSHRILNDAEKFKIFPRESKTEWKSKLKETVEWKKLNSGTVPVITLGLTGQILITWWVQK